MFFDQQKEIYKRKFPRLFLADKQNEITNETLANLAVVWPDKTTSNIFDLSESGLLVSSKGMLSQVKIGQNLEVRLKIKEEIGSFLKVRVLRITAGSILLMLDSISFEGRLKISQDDREFIIRSSWQSQPIFSLPSSFLGTNMTWHHSVFDSNIWLWRGASREINQMMVEFESVAFVYDQRGARYIKTPSAFDETKSYVGPLIDPLPHKVEPGHNWRERFLKSLPRGPLLPADFIPTFSRLTSNPAYKQINV